MSSLVRSVLRDGKELLSYDEPLDAELWASDVLGLWYKVPISPVDREDFEKRIREQVVVTAETEASAESVAVLSALAAMDPDPLAGPAAAAVSRLRSAGIGTPPWQAALQDGPQALGAWMLSDPYGDQDGYYIDFCYPGGERHAIGALVDQTIGGICKDAFLVDSTDVVRKAAEADGEVTVRDIDAVDAAALVLQAIETGDTYVDNDWIPEFKATRALLRARMHRLSPTRGAHYREPLSNRDRDAIAQEFLRSADVEDLDVAERIVELAIDYACDYTPDGDPYRWSPTVVEVFLLGWLPRQALLDIGEVRGVPSVLKLWVEFAASKRGLDDPLVEETTRAIDAFEPPFLKAATDQKSLGPSKAIANAMMASGVDLSDQAAVSAWIEEFNSRPFEERDELLGPAIDPD